MSIDPMAEYNKRTVQPFIRKRDPFVNVDIDSFNNLKDQVLNTVTVFLFVFHFYVCCFSDRRVDYENS